MFGNSSDIERKLSPHLSSPLVWLISAAISIVTTRHLIVHTRPHYPYHLLCLHIIAGLLLRCVRRTTSSTSSSPTWQQTPSTKSGIFVAKFVAYIAFVVGALISTYQAYWHTETVATLVMIMTLDWRPLFGATGSINGTTSLLPRLMRSLGFVAGVTLICIADYRLTDKAFLDPPLSAALVGLAEIAGHWLDTDKESEIVDVSTDDLWLSPGTCALAVALPICMFMVWLEESPIGASFISMPKGILAVNIFASAIAYYSSPATYRLISNGQPTVIDGSSDDLEQSSFGRAALSVGLVGIVLPTSSTSETFVVVSWWQVMGYFLAMTASLHVSDIIPSARAARYETIRLWDRKGTDAEQDVEAEALLSDQYQDTDTNDERPSWLRIARLVVIALLFIGSTVALCWPGMHEHPKFEVALGHPSLDADFQPERGLDIVIARYHEPPEQIREALLSLLHQPTVASLRPKVWLYDKNQTEDQAALWDAISEGLPLDVDYEIKPSENLGREGYTYLQHITEQWDGLADHTIFVQAHPHEWTSAVQRLQDYFVPNTGFLSLSYVGQFCEDCNTCIDHSNSFSEDPAVLRDLYQRANSGAECKDLSLTYRGQFIVSAGRLRGKERQMYEQMRQDLVAREDGKPALDGYTLERMWGPIMQCSNRKIAFECPSLISGMLGHGAHLDSCQCLDS